MLRFTPYSRSSYGYEVPPAYRTKLISKEILQKKLEELTEMVDEDKNSSIFITSSYNYEFLLVHGVQHYINRLSATALAPMPFRVEKLVYGYIEHCDKLEE